MFIRNRWKEPPGAVVSGWLNSWFQSKKNTRSKELNACFSLKKLIPCLSAGRAQHQPWRENDQRAPLHRQWGHHLWAAEGGRETVLGGEKDQRGHEALSAIASPEHNLKYCSYHKWQYSCLEVNRRSRRGSSPCDNNNFIQTTAGRAVKQCISWIYL